MGVVVVSLAACSSSKGTPSAGDGGGGSGGDDPELTCIFAMGPALDGQDACNACLEANCASEVSSSESGCKDWLACACPGGTYNPQGLDSQSCTTATETCTCATLPLYDCSNQNCMSTCGDTQAGGNCGGTTG